MKIVKKIAELKRLIKLVKNKKKIIGFVPTMGYLHEGHLSLIRIARKHSDYVVCSIFVNPIQFGPNEDFNRYPRDFKRDESLLKKEKVDLLFYPSVKEMYPEGYKTYVEVEGLSSVLCGKSRPGHFRGVATVVLKLFNIVQPDIAVFGEKDYQQALIIKQMVRDLNLNVKIITAPIVRESDGLAMSSRNTYLNTEERVNATIINQALIWARDVFYKENIKSPEYILNRMRQMIEDKGGTIDYIAIVDKETLEPVRFVKKGDRILLAVYFGRTRLIDNTAV
ncbi:MAG: pantoate--beta-alanine ligase [candidate division WOR-3 bacterium]|nr:pantoate--beta-alanine ligase [candidate division WOR-3 bacterium]